jgi:hypothetical protein
MDIQSQYPQIIYPLPSLIVLAQLLGASSSSSSIMAQYSFKHHRRHVFLSILMPG